MTVRAVAIGLLIAVALAGCGRRGALEPPPGAVAPTPAAAPTVFGASPPPPAPTATDAAAPKRPFLLDFLI